MLKDMRIFLFNGFILLGFVVASVQNAFLDSFESEEIEDQHLPINMCHYVRMNSVLEAQCFGLQGKIPLDLNPDIQVLKITTSTIVRLSNDSLHAYKKLAYIYLNNNVILDIKEAAFANQPYLEVLDLSHNFCSELPKSLFQMPYLHSLYLANNAFRSFMTKEKVTSPIRVLQLSFNGLTAIPNLGVLPTLFNLDVSDNNIFSISTEDLAPFCSLKELDLTGNSISFKTGSCDCERFNAWVNLRQIKMKSDDLYDCTDSVRASLNEDCANVRFSNRTYELYNECLAMMQQKMEKNIQQKMEDIQQKMEPEKPRSVWISVAPCVSVFLFVVFVALFCVHKRYHRRCMKQEEQLMAIYDETELQQEPDNN